MLAVPICDELVKHAAEFGIAQQIFERDIAEGCLAVFIVPITGAGHGVGGGYDGEVGISRGAVYPAGYSKLFEESFSRLFSKIGGADHEFERSRPAFVHESIPLFIDAHVKGKP